MGKTRLRLVALTITSLTLLSVLLLPLGVIRGSAAVLTTNQTNLTFTSSAGVTSSYHLYASGVTEPAGLLLQFHGDGAYEFKHPTSSYSLGGAQGIVAQALARNFITVPVLSPDRSGEVTWWESGARNADYVRDLLLDLKSRYNIRSDRIWLTGYSGGAQFITQFFLPKYSSLIDGGGAVIIGGGESPAVTSQAFSESLRSNFAMHWYTGANDTGWDGDGWNALAAAKAGEAWYASKGFRTSHEWPAGVSHTLDGKFGGILAQQLGSHPSTTPSGSASSSATPTTPAPRPTNTPTASPTGWTSSVKPRSNGVAVTVNVPRTATGRTVLYVYSSTGSYWYRSAAGTGEVTLNILTSLRPSRAYTFRITNAGVQVAAGSFTTLP